MSMTLLYLKPFFCELNYMVFFIKKNKKNTGHCKVKGFIAFASLSNCIF